MIDGEVVDEGEIGESGDIGGMMGGGWRLAPPLVGFKSDSCVASSRIGFVLVEVADDGEGAFGTFGVSVNSDMSLIDLCGVAGTEALPWIPSSAAAVVVLVGGVIDLVNIACRGG